MAYTVSKLKDYSAAALEKAAAECVHACTGESAASDRKLRTNSDKCTPSEEAVSPAPVTPAPEPAEVSDEL